MKSIARRIAIVLSATAVTVGLMGVAAPADAAKATAVARPSATPAGTDC